MITSFAVMSAALAALLGDIIVFVLWRKKNAILSRNLAIASCIAFAVAILCIFDLFTQVWVASPDSVSGPVLIGSGLIFLCLSAAAVATLIARWQKSRHAAA